MPAGPDQGRGAGTRHQHLGLDRHFRRYGSPVRGKIATLGRLAGLMHGRTSPSKLLIKRPLRVWSVRKSPLGHSITPCRSGPVRSSAR
jgi:hypothetical protein